MSEPYVIVRRYPYYDVEPDLTKLEFEASNGPFSGIANDYFAPDKIADMGRVLKNFPSKAEDEYRFEVENRYMHFLLRAYVTDAAAHCALQIVIDLSDREPDEGRSAFSIRAEAAAINRLGELFENFSKLNHLELEWNLKGGELYEEHQTQAWRG